MAADSESLTPSAPEGVVASRDWDGAVRLDWANPSYAGASVILYFNVYRSAGEAAAEQIGQALNPPYLDGTANVNVSYSYFVTAVNAYGEGQASLTVGLPAGKSCQLASVGEDLSVSVDSRCARPPIAQSFQGISVRGS